MNYVLTAEDVRQAERRAMDGGATLSMLKMRAALAVADMIKDRASADGVTTAVFCGQGNNGADGLLVASRLHSLGCSVKVYLVYPEAKGISEELASAKAFGVSVMSASEYEYDADIIIDAIFGFGLNRAIEGEAADIINRLNKQGNALKGAGDIPSGLHPDTGEVLGTAFKADATVTFSCYKRGMLFGDGREYCGRIAVADIGVDVRSVCRVYEDTDFKAYKRKRNAHKGTNGRIFVIGGCATMVGAPVLAGAAAHAASLNGAGTTTVCVPAVNRVALASRSALSMMKFLPDTVDGFIRFDETALDEIIEKADAIDVGMGMGNAPDLKRIIEYLCANYDKTLVIDADGINAIKNDYGFLKDSRAKIILTPHVGEFKRLTGMEATEENARSLAKELGVIVVLKFDTTVIPDGNEVRMNLAGTPALAKGGSGDVLGGCIAALSRSFSPLDAATVACYRNGLGAERAVSSYAELMLTPKEFLKYADYEEI
ncbi:MAG: NAD(P)H-hydrate dehydratase, partial [Clostridiales bacterium]|nr:NAD(P)H-hydrate dehydratase [Clostridiales bacterium]